MSKEHSVSGIGNLISAAFTSLKTHAKAVLIGAAVFGSILGAVNVSMQSHVEEGAKSVAERMGMDIDEMQKLSKRMQAGDEEAMKEMMGTFDVWKEKLEGKTEDEAATIVTVTMLKEFGIVLRSLFFGSFIAILAGMASSLYFLLLAIQKEKDAIAVFHMMPKHILPFIGIAAWTFIRSFLWIPFLGILIAIALVPRFAFAPYILLTQNKGVFESVSLSYAQTRGRWWDIVVNVFVTGILIGIIAAFVSGFAGLILSVYSHGFAEWGNAFIMQCAMAAMAFVTVLYAPHIIKKK